MAVTVWLFLVVGLLSIGYSFFLNARHRRLRREGVPVQGVVVRHVRHSGGEGGSTYHAVVNFTDADGNPREYQIPVSGVKGLPVGGQVALLYLPGAPNKVGVALASKRRQEIAIPAVVGSLFIATAIFFMSGVAHGHG
ncbi:DUF3592 domain-containing protein [Streptomyces silvisoli]|uniref:DUF3592 domain-containing protein n=1 Tax=Streptomyces silvisoli TaxID=3034235 RepID=A0ABT5ZNX5_9ACTN|nr:DUF3592 domain-containing protein [Streptomyces silvisoli]MDF3290708.1 DUF3592 domain-containing protein [Streptomyces silvisoli]